VVTGASSGIGRALALELASRGYRVGLVARRRKALEDLAGEIEMQGGRAQAAAADVGDRQTLHAAIQQIERALGPADVIVANAGIGTPTQLAPLNVADVEDTFRINVLGVIYSIEAVLPGMLERGWGQLVAVSSMAAFKGLPGESAYCASKAAVNLYMEGLRIALRHRGIAVTTICPGFVATAITPMDAAAAPFEISAEAAARRIARAVDKRTSGLIQFPWPMAMLMALICRLPDFLVAHLVGHEEGRPRPSDALSR
jgi:short-subunit dehydrogenase